MLPMEGADWSNWKVARFSGPGSLAVDWSSRIDYFFLRGPLLGFFLARADMAVSGVVDAAGVLGAGSKFPEVIGGGKGVPGGCTITLRALSSCS